MGFFKTNVCLTHSFCSCAQLTALKRHLWGATGSLSEPKGYHAKDMRHFCDLTKTGVSNDAAAAAVLATSAERNTRRSTLDKFVFSVCLVVAASMFFFCDAKRGRRRSTRRPRFSCSRSLLCSCMRSSAICLSNNLKANFCRFVVAADERS